jgi:hypothetical protein
LSSRPERSVVEGPAVSLPVLTQTTKALNSNESNAARLGRALRRES